MSPLTSPISTLSTGLSQALKTAVLIVMLSSQLLACTAAKAQPQITVYELATQIEQNIENDTLPVILDVRTAEEYAAGHIPGAVNIDHREISNNIDRLRAFENREIVVYCERGIRAGRAEKILTEAGFSAVIELEGDIAAWREAELPIEVEE